MKHGPAKADRLRDEFASLKRLRERAMDEDRARGELPSYNDEAESEITGNWKSVNAKLALPRIARMVIGIGIGVSIAALGITAAVVALVKAFR